MIAWARKGFPDFKSGSVHAGRRDSIIAFNCFLWIEISPGADGMRPLFLAISKDEKPYYVINKTSIKRFMVNLCDIKDLLHPANIRGSPPKG